MIIVTISASALLALVSAASGIPKIVGSSTTIKEARHLGMSRTAYTVIGSLELAAAVALLAGLAVRPLGTAAATGLVLMMTGAVASHARAGDRFAAMAPALTVGAASAITLALLVTTA